MLNYVKAGKEPTSGDSKIVLQADSFYTALKTEPGLRRIRGLWRCTRVLVARRIPWALSENFSVIWSANTASWDELYFHPAGTSKELFKPYTHSWRIGNKCHGRPVRLWNQTYPQLFLNFCGGNKALSCVCHLSLHGWSVCPSSLSHHHHQQIAIFHSRRPHHRPSPCVNYILFAAIRSWHTNGIS